MFIHTAQSMNTKEKQEISKHFKQEIAENSIDEKYHKHRSTGWPIPKRANGAPLAEPNGTGTREGSAMEGLIEGSKECGRQRIHWPLWIQICVHHSEQKAMYTDNGMCYMT